MAKRRALSFISNAPDDWLFDSYGNTIAPGNRWNAEFIAKALAEGGHTVGPLHNRDDYGWEFSCEYSGDNFWLLIAYGPNPAEVYAWVKHDRSLMQWLRRRGRELRDRTIELLARALRADPHFANVHEAQI
jgi:hypothetical protein